MLFRSLPDDPVVRTGTARGVPYVVLVNPGKGLSGPPTLGDQAIFWSEVALDTGRPDWLSAPDPL